MKSAIGNLYYILLLVTTTIGLLRYRQVDRATQAIVMVLGLTTVSEGLSYLAVQLGAYGIRYTIYHVYNVLQALLLTRFFIYALRPRHSRSLLLAAYVTWPLLGLLNALFLQPCDKLNTNILLLETFCLATLSLYYIYTVVRSDIATNIFRHPHFQLAIICLISWSGTFFFWAFIGILYHEQWPYTDLVMYSHALLNILTYAAIAAVIWYYPKQTAAHAHY